jgi:hypothetical protein
MSVMAIYHQPTSSSYTASAWNQKARTSVIWRCMGDIKIYGQGY